MRIDTESLRRHYESLPDGALLALDRGELTDAARSVYDEEVSRRELNSEDASPEQTEEMGDGGAHLDVGPDPNWLEEAACACSFPVRDPSSNDVAADACGVLHTAGIPYHIVTIEDAPPRPGEQPRYFLQLMVPAALALHATSVLDRDIFNEEQEVEWRASLEALSDDELRSLMPDIFCAGLLDRLARLKKAYQEEMSRRTLTPRR